MNCKDLQATVELLRSIRPEALTADTQERIDRACADLERLDDAMAVGMARLGRALTQAVDDFAEMIRFVVPQQILAEFNKAIKTPEDAKEYAERLLGPGSAFAAAKTAVKNAS